MQNTHAGRRFWSIMLKKNAVALAVVFAIGLAADMYLNEPGERSGFWAGLIAIAAYLLAMLALGLVTLVSGLIYLWLFQAQDIQDLALDDFRKFRIPSPGVWQEKRFDYLIEVSEDEDQPAHVRVQAGAMYAGYQVAIQRAGLFGGLAMAKALDAAALRYSQESPRKPVSFEQSDEND